MQTHGLARIFHNNSNNVTNLYETKISCHLIAFCHKNLLDFIANQLKLRHLDKQPYHSVAILYISFFSYLLNCRLIATLQSLLLPFWVSIENADPLFWGFGSILFRLKKIYVKQIYRHLCHDYRRYESRASVICMLKKR